MGLSLSLGPPDPLYQACTGLTTGPLNTNRGGRLSTVELLIKVACFVKKENNIFSMKMSCDLYYKSFTIVIYDCNDSTIV